MIRIDAAWIAVEPLDMRAGVDTGLARVVKVFGEARSHHAYMFLNRRANRLKVFVHGPHRDTEQRSPGWKQFSRLIKEAAMCVNRDTRI